MRLVCASISLHNTFWSLLYGTRGFWCCHPQDVTDSVFYDEFGRIMMSAPIVGLDFTRYLPVVIVPYALLQV